MAAGLVFVYLFMSVLATVAREAMEGFLKRRARHLEKGLMELLCDHPPETPVGKGKTTGYEMLKAFYDHPIVMSLYRGRYTIPPKRNFLQGRKLPSYIPSSHFAFVVLDLLAEIGGRATEHGVDLNAVMNGSKQLGNKRMARMIQFAVSNSGGDVERARQFIENWFNSTMDRVSGWYRLETQTLLFWASLLACVVLNVNTVVIADTLYRSPTLRKGVETAAEIYYQEKVKDQSADADMADARTMITDDKNPINQLGLPVGWTQQTRADMARLFARAETAEIPKPLSTDVAPPTGGPVTWTDKVIMFGDSAWRHVVNFYYGRPELGNYTLFNILPFFALIMGWVMTAFAVTLGAPFWFDVLGRLMSVRSTFKPDGKGNFSTASLGALASALVPAATASTTTPQLSYNPDFAASSAAAAQPVVDDSDNLDPSLRPRDA